MDRALTLRINGLYHHGYYSIKSEIALLPTRIFKKINIIQNLIPILRMEYKSSDLDTFTRICSLSFGIDKRGMRHSSSSTIGLGIKTLDQSDHLRRLSIAVVPLVCWVRSHSVSLSGSIGVNQRDTDEVAVGDSVSIRDSQWVLVDGLYRAPDIDDLVTTLEKLVGFVREVVSNTVLAGFVRLVDVHALYWTSELSLWSASVLWSSSDSVIKDEDAGSSGPIAVSHILSAIYPRISRA